MKTTGIIISLLFLSMHVSAQFNLEFQSGYAQYSMKSLKQYQETLRKSYPPQAIVTESFPAFSYYGVNAKWTYKDMHLGMSVSFGSTGGQVYYRDFSGTAYEQQMFKYTSVNSIIAKKWSFGDNDKTVITLDPRIGIVFGKLRLDNSFHTMGDQGIHSNSTYTFRATNISAEPTVSVFHRFGILGLTAFAGYHLDFAPSAFKFDNRGTLFSSTISDVETRKMELSGYRVGAAVGLYFKKADESEFTRLYVAPGMGLDYGGIGLNFTLMATRYAGVFVGAGYNLNSIGSNAGVRLFVRDDQASFRPSLSLMYGYNSVVVVKNAEGYNRTFYGTTLMIGADVKAAEKRFWNFGLGIPFRGSDVDNYIHVLKGAGATFPRGLLPITISFGYRIGVD